MPMHAEAATMMQTLTQRLPRKDFLVDAAKFLVAAGGYWLPPSPRNGCRQGFGQCNQAVLCDRWDVLKRTVTESGKGWFAGPWDSPLPVAIGYSDTGVDEPHLHETMFEVYLVARGSSTAEVDGRVIDLNVGDMLVVEPGEAHTFRSSSADYLHFVVQTPFVPGDKRTV